MKLNLEKQHVEMAHPAGNQRHAVNVKKWAIIWVVCWCIALSGYAWGEAKAPGEQNEGGKNVLININTAGPDQLSQLPRVGQKTAERIIEYRQKNGKFKSPQDIMKVKGIGEKTYKKMEKMITV